MIEFTIAIKPHPMHDPAPCMMPRAGTNGRPRTVLLRSSGPVAVGKLLGIIRKHMILVFRPRNDDAQYKAALIRAMRPHVPDEPLVGPLRLDAYFVFKFRQADSKEFRSAETQVKDTQPDCDNLCKALGDAMEKAGFFGNDGQISTAMLRKRWGARDLVHVVLRPDDGGCPAPSLFDAASVART